eukprot:gene13371-15799_t
MSRQACGLLAAVLTGAHLRAAGLRELQQNALSLGIPQEIYHLEKLINLDLSENALTGAIWSELGLLSALTALGVHTNQLQGPVPTELGALTRLTALLAQSNSLRGTVPTEIGALSRMEYMRFTRNLLAGTIPTALGQLSLLEELYLCENSLTNQLPTELGNLDRLEVIGGAEAAAGTPGAPGALVCEPTPIHVFRTIPVLVWFRGILMACVVERWSSHFALLLRWELHGFGLRTRVAVMWPMYVALFAACPAAMVAEAGESGLHNNMLQGTIPSQLSDLPEAQWDLSYNPDLCGEIPEGVDVQSTDGTGLGAPCPATDVIAASAASNAVSGSSGNLIELLAQAQLLSLFYWLRAPPGFLSTAFLQFSSSLAWTNL